MPEGDGGFGGVISVPNPLGINKYTNTYEFIIDLAKTLYTNYPIEHPDAAADRAITYAQRFYNRMPYHWRQYLETQGKTTEPDNGSLP